MKKKNTPIFKWDTQAPEDISEVVEGPSEGPWLWEGMQVCFEFFCGEPPALTADTCAAAGK